MSDHLRSDPPCSPRSPASSPPTRAACWSRRSCCFSLAAGVGAPVTGLLSVDPDLDFVDPQAESNVTGNELRDAVGQRPEPGHRRARALRRPVRSAAGRAPSCSDVVTTIEADPAIARTSSALSDPRPASPFVSRDGQRELRRRLHRRRPRQRRRRRAHRGQARRRARRQRRRPRRRRPGGRRPGLRRSRQGRAARLPAAVPALARRLPRRDRRAAAAVRRPADDHGHVPRPAPVQRGARRCRSSR